jgi:nucleoside 2-deoxyribosyltransferase
MALEKVIDPRAVYDRDVAWIRACDALIAEVSVPSHGVGYEIGFALEAGKQVLCLAQAGMSVSKMITGNPHPTLQAKYYRDVAEGVAMMREFLSGIICE